MKQVFQENKNAFLLLLALLFVLLLAVYILFYRPVAADNERVMNQEETLQHEVELLEVQLEQLGEDETEADEETLELQRKIPRLPELEAYLLTLNDIELVSDTLINHMSFGYQGELPERNIAAAEEEDTESEEVDEDSEESEEVNGEQGQESPIEFEEMPAGLQPVNVTLDVEAPDYDHFQQLLQEIEKQERIMIVTNVNFNSPGEYELLLAEETDETVTATIDITTFYYED